MSQDHVGQRPETSGTSTTQGHPTQGIHTPLGRGSETSGNRNRLDPGKTGKARVVKAGSPRGARGGGHRASLNSARLENDLAASRGGMAELARPEPGPRGHCGSGASAASACPGDPRRLPGPRAEPRPRRPPPPRTSRRRRRRPAPFTPPHAGLPGGRPPPSPAVTNLRLTERHHTREVRRDKEDLKKKP